MASNPPSIVNQGLTQNRPPIERLLKPAQVADILGIGKSAAYRLLGRELLAVRFGKSVRVRLADLERFIEDRVSGGE